MRLGRTFCEDLAERLQGIPGMGSCALLQAAPWPFNDFKTFKLMFHVGF